MFQMVIQIPAHEEAVMKAKGAMSDGRYIQSNSAGPAPVWCRCWLGCTRRSAHWHQLVNTIDPPVCGGNAALCQITLTAARY